MEENYDNSKYKAEEKKTFRTFYWILGSAIAVMIAAPILIHNLSGTNDSTRGSFGDMYGVVNALFSGLATGGVILAILLQRLDLKIQRQELRNSIEQLELQRDEMKLQRQEMRQSTAEIRAQKEILDRQNFEDKFFKLLENHKKNAESVTYRRIDPQHKFTSSGKLAFLNMADVILKHEKVKNKEIRRIDNGIVDTYNEYFANTLNSIELSHYFRNLYFFVQFLDSQDSISNRDKNIYIKILRANLSNYEIFMLALNGLSVRGKEFKPLIEKYKLLKNLVFEKRFSEKFKGNINFIESQYPHLQASFDEQRKNHYQSQL